MPWVSCSFQLQYMGAPATLFIPITRHVCCTLFSFWERDMAGACSFQLQEATRLPDADATWRRISSYGWGCVCVCVCVCVRVFASVWVPSMYVCVCVYTFFFGHLPRRLCNLLRSISSWKTDRW